MNLGKLLIAGNSFFGGGRKAEYRLDKHVSLPKFNEGRNPFAPKGAEPAEPAKAEQTAAAPVAAVQKAPPPYAFKPKPLKRGGRLLSPSPVPATAVAQAAKPARTGWSLRLNPFRAREVSVPSASAVQSELTLNAVKVVHNDLADADVEVVPVKSHTEVVETPVLPPARRAWEYVGENLLKS
jgi:hypothetical protein